MFNTCSPTSLLRQKEDKKSEGKQFSKKFAGVRIYGEPKLFKLNCQGHPHLPFITGCPGKIQLLFSHIKHIQIRTHTRSDKKSKRSWGSNPNQEILPRFDEIKNQTKLKLQKSNRIEKSNKKSAISAKLKNSIKLKRKKIDKIKKVDKVEN